jgi:hypothetical protein
MQICRYKLESSTLNSVLDCDSNKTITKKIGWKGPKLYSAKGMTKWYIVVHCLHCSSVFYDLGMIWLVYIVRVWLVYILWLFYIVRIYGIFQV